MIQKWFIFIQIFKFPFRVDYPTYRKIGITIIIILFCTWLVYTQSVQCWIPQNMFPTKKQVIYIFPTKKQVIYMFPSKKAGYIHVSNKKAGYIHVSNKKAGYISLITSVHCRVQLRRWFRLSLFSKYMKSWKTHSGKKKDFMHCWCTYMYACVYQCDMLPIHHKLPC